MTHDLAEADTKRLGSVLVGTNVRMDSRYKWWTHKGMDYDCLTFTVEQS